MGLPAGAKSGSVTGSPGRPPPWHSADSWLGGLLAFCAAVIGASVLVCVSMRFSALILRPLRANGVELLTGISGLLLSAIAVQLVAGAIRALAEQG